MKAAHLPRVEAENRYLLGSYLRKGKLASRKEWSTRKYVIAGLISEKRTMEWWQEQCKLLGQSHLFPKWLLFGFLGGRGPLKVSALTWEHQFQSHSQSGTPRGPLPCWWTKSLCCLCHSCRGGHHHQSLAEMWSQTPWRKGNAGAPEARALQRRISGTLWTEGWSGWKLKKGACC